MRSSSLRRLAFVAAVPFAAVLSVTTPVSAQEIALKGGVAISRFDVAGDVPFDGKFVSSSFGGHVRFTFGFIALQPELYLVSRGGTAPGSAIDEQIRLDYMEVPVLLVLPMQVGSFEPYAFGGPMIGIEARCRTTIIEDGLKTSFGCDDSATGGGVFNRGMIDYGLSAGGGLSHRLGSGRILVEGRHTWGMRNIYDGEEPGAEVRNRSFIFSIGYTMAPATPGGR